MKRRSNPRLSLRTVTSGLASSIPTGLAAGTTVVGGWAFAKTLLGSRDVGPVGWLTNLLGGGVLAGITGVIFGRRAMNAAFVGAVASPTIRIMIEMLRGRTLPLGIQTGFEGYGKCYQDYLVNPAGSIPGVEGIEPVNQGTMADYLVGDGLETMSDHNDDGTMATNPSGEEWTGYDDFVMGVGKDEWSSMDNGAF